jgi:hypothetical protein
VKGRLHPRIDGPRVRLRRPDGAGEVAGSSDRSRRSGWARLQRQRAARTR